MDNYAEWIKEHPESDQSREDYDRDKDTYYNETRMIKEAQRKADAKFATYSYWE